MVVQTEGAPDAGELIRCWRTRRGLSQLELSPEANVSTKHLSFVATGRFSPNITVDPEQRECYLAGCMSVVEEARRADGCLDFAITADLLDPSAAEYDIANVRPLFGKGRA